MKYALIFVLYGIFSLSAEAKSLTQIQEGLNLEMCRSKDHHFSMTAANCTYCAQGLHLNVATGKCEGSSNVFGKCIGEDHYHAATHQCVYCAHGYKFDEDLRHCTEVVH